MQVSPIAENRQIYVFKKRKIPISHENYKNNFIFGLLSSSPLLQLSCIIEQVNVILSLLHEKKIYALSILCTCLP